jgi:hypothetical protein
MDTAASAGSLVHSARRAAQGILLAVLLAAGAASAQDERYLRVGTGPPGETRFPMGGLIASAISNPPGAQPCARGGSCGVPGLIAVAVASSGSVGDISGIDAGRFDAALVQSDVALWAGQGVDPFAGHPIASVRSVAHLYSVQFHLIARPGAGIKSPADLKGKRVSLGENGSGALVHARRLLAAWNIPERSLKAQYLRSALAADALQSGTLDAFFVFDRAPVPTVAELAKAQPIRLVPIAGDGADRLRRDDPLLSPSVIAAGTYQGLGDDVPTLEVGISLVVSANLAEDLVYALTQALWHPTTLNMLKLNQPRGVSIELGRAPLGLPLHPGAARYYDENGISPLTR